MATDGQIEQPEAGSSTAAEAHTCTWVFPSRGGYRCDSPIELEQISFCILHDPNENKDFNLFEERLMAKIRSDEANPDITVINLSGVVFPKEVDFNGFIFKKTVRFVYAIFTKHANFADTEFTRNVHFSYVMFLEGANFSRCRFAGDATFVEAFLAGGGTDFADAEFGGEAAFTDAEFDSFANFVESRFLGRTRFWDTIFVGEVTFSLAYFGNEASFVGTTFYTRAFFDLVTLGSNVRFEHVELTNVSFWRSDIRLLSLVGCSWASKSDPILWPFPLRWPKFVLQSRSALAAELDLLGRTGHRRETSGDDKGGVIQGSVIHRDYSSTAIRIHWVSESYRQLRLNYESHRQESEAGDFYIGQMEMRRQDPSQPWPYRWLLGIYRVLAMYGESYIRPVLFYLAFGVLFALVYLLGGLRVGEVVVSYSLRPELSNALPYFQDFTRAYVQALTAGGITMLGGQFAAPHEGGAWWVPAVRYLNMVLDTFLVGFFVIALRRHFRR